MSRYSGPIVDAHQHFWRPSNGRIPWLQPQANIPFRYGDYSALKQDYLPPDLLADAEGLPIVGTVWMETEWDRDDPVGEIADLVRTREQYGLPDAAVAHAILVDPDVDRTLAALVAESDLVRAVRNKPGQAPTPKLARSQPTLMSSPDWRRGYSRLRQHGLDFELQTAWWHLDEALDLVRAFPDTAIMINHAALPADRSADGIAGWTAALRRIAAAEQVSIKVSGIGRPGLPWTAEGNRIIVDTIADIFGPDRMLFASNFPVDSLTGSYRDIYDGFLTLTESWSPSEQQAAFIGNAIKAYRLDPDLVTRSGPDPRARRR